MTGRDWPKWPRASAKADTPLPTGNDAPASLTPEGTSGDEVPSISRSASRDGVDGNELVSALVASTLMLAKMSDEVAALKAEPTAGAAVVDGVTSVRCPTCNGKGISGPLPHPPTLPREDPIGVLVAEVRNAVMILDLAEGHAGGRAEALRRITEATAGLMALRDLPAKLERARWWALRWKRKARELTAQEWGAVTNATAEDLTQLPVERLHLQSEPGDRHFCAGLSCPGLPYRASDKWHPASCALRPDDKPPPPPSPVCNCGKGEVSGRFHDGTCPVYQEYFADIPF